MKKVNIYINGHALKNPGASGAGIVLVCGEHQKELLVPLGRGTNNAAELQAAINGITQLKQPCDVNIYSCSQWFVKCASGDWNRSSNQELWERYVEVSASHRIAVHWIRKNSHDLNHRARMLANEASNDSAIKLGSEE